LVPLTTTVARVAKTLAERSQQPDVQFFGVATGVSLMLTAYLVAPSLRAWVVAVVLATVTYVFGTATADHWSAVKLTVLLFEVLGATGAAVLL